MMRIETRLLEVPEARSLAMEHSTSGHRTTCSLLVGLLAG